jgi:site-specific recombinase XerD
MKGSTLGQVLYSFFEDHLKAQKGVRPLTVKSYRDTLRLFLQFVAADARRPISRLVLEDLTFERVLSFLRHIEEVRHNHIRTRNQRLAALRTFFEYLVIRIPEMLSVAERVAAIHTKRTAPSETFFLERDQVTTLFATLPSDDWGGVRDRALLLFLYNTGARAQEVAELRVANLDLAEHPRVHLHGKGDKWRTCPLWTETAEQLRALLKTGDTGRLPNDPVFTSRSSGALTRFGIYKIVRRHCKQFDATHRCQRVSPHVFRHTTAMHLLEAGVEVNVIRGWLGHVSLETTNRYAEINISAKEAALQACEPPTGSSEGFPQKPVWRSDQALLNWLDSL